MATSVGTLELQCTVASCKKHQTAAPSETHRSSSAKHVRVLAEDSG